MQRLKIVLEGESKRTGRDFRHARLNALSLSYFGKPKKFLKSKKRYQKKLAEWTEKKVAAFEHAENMKEVFTKTMREDYPFLCDDGYTIDCNTFEGGSKALMVTLNKTEIDE